MRGAEVFEASLVEVFTGESFHGAETRLDNVPVFFDDPSLVGEYCDDKEPYPPMLILRQWAVRAHSGLTIEISRLSLEQGLRIVSCSALEARLFNSALEEGGFLPINLGSVTEL